MELKEIIELIRKGSRTIVVSTLLCAVVGAAVTYLLPTKYRSSIDVYVKRRGTQESENYYTYDGYYSTQASVQYTDTVSGLFQSTQILRKAAENIEQDERYIASEKEPAVLSADVDYLEAIGDKVVVEDIAPQVISVGFTHTDETKSQLWLSYLSDAVIEEVEKLNKVGDSKFDVSTLDTPIIKEVVPSYTLNVLIGLMSGALIGSVVVFTKRYFETSK